jgi:hypothetical protein
VTITLNIPPDLEAGLLAQAQAGGRTVEQFLLSMVEGAVTPDRRLPLSPRERAEAFQRWSIGHRPTPLLSDYAVSRESMYGDRDAS